MRLLLTIFILPFGFIIMGHATAKEQKVPDGFSGDTIAGMLLGDDIFKEIKHIEKSQFNCKYIDSIHAEIKISDTPPPQTSFSELWQVTACTDKHEYIIRVKMEQKAGRPEEYRIDSIELVD